MKAIVGKFSVRSTLSNNQMNEYPDFALLMLRKKNSTFISTIDGGAITRNYQLEGLSNLDQGTSLYAKRPRPLKIMGLNSPEAVLTWWALPEMNIEIINLFMSRS